MRHLGIDFGERRVGLAISDSGGAISTPLSTLERTSDRQVIDRIRDIVEDEEIGALVVGEPRLLDGSVGEAAERVQGFARKLGRATGLAVHLIDEALSSHEAEARLRAAGVPPKRRRGKIDALAAQILLQDWLDQERP
jgi:putative Holliday junction resolvase